MANPKTKAGAKPQSKGKTDGTQKRVDFKQREAETKTAVQSKMYEAIKYDASNIYFNNLVGTDLRRRPADTATRLPGILIFRSAPNFVSRSDMVNVAATSIYTYVRHANSGHTNYESSDLMVYLLAMSEVYVAIAELSRAYGIASYFTSQNLYSGHILKTLGFKPINTRNQLADFRYALNVLINKVKAFAVPKAFNYFDERVSEHINVFSDEPGDRGQFIAIVPGVRGRFNATAQGGSSLDFVPVPGDRDVFSYINEISLEVDNLRANEDINIMSGDIMKAYGDNLYVPQPIPVDMITVPVFDELQLLQFQNGHFPATLNTTSLYQANNRLYQEVTIADDAYAASYTEKRYLNSPYDGIDANMIFAISKYQLTASKLSDEEMGLVSGNTTVLYGMKLYVIGNNGLDLYAYNIYQHQDALTSAFPLIYFSKFRHHPYVYFDTNSLPLGDMHYVALLSETDTNRMNDARFILAFQTVQMG